MHPVDVLSVLVGSGQGQNVTHGDNLSVSYLDVRRWTPTSTSMKIYIARRNPRCRDTTVACVADGTTGNTPSIRDYLPNTRVKQRAVAIALFPTMI